MVGNPADSRVEVGEHEHGVPGVGNRGPSEVNMDLF
jgi:hypothetical protein